MKTFKKLINENIIDTNHFLKIQTFFGKENMLIMSNKKTVIVKVITTTREKDYPKLGALLDDLGIQHRDSTSKSDKFAYEFDIEGKTYRYVLKPPTGQKDSSLAAEDFEAVLCTVQNYGITGDLEDAFLLSGANKEKMSAVLDIADAYKDTLLESLKKNGISGQLIVNGRAKEKPTDVWVQYVKEGGNTTVDSTPKTDILSPNGSNRISVKKAASQLLSSGVGETYATFKTALNNTGADYNAVILEEIKNNMKKYKHKSTVNDIKNMSKDEMDSVQEEIYNTVLNNKEFKVKIINELQKNSKLKHEIVKEAMTGQGKFGDSISTAEFILVLNEQGNEVTKFKKIVDVVDEYASKVKVDLAFKTSGQAKWTSFRMITEAFDETEQEMMNEGIKDVFNNIKDFFGKMLNKLLEKFIAIKDKLLELLDLNVEIAAVY